MHGDEEMKNMLPEERIDLGIRSVDEIDRIIRETGRFNKPGERIDFISKIFLNTPYIESTLIGSSAKREVFVVNFKGVDCFTFIDYVEAMRLSGSFGEFKENLKKIRYQNSIVEFGNRNHFFTDWIEFNGRNIHDVTALIGGSKTKKTKKMLNVNEDGTFLLQGVVSRGREIAYIPAHEINAPVVDAMNTGDYCGMYSEQPGLDVSHVGIIIKKDNDETLLRHASSLEQYRKVVDQPLMGCLSGKAGLVILRPFLP